MGYILPIAFPKRLADLKLCIYYQGSVEPPRELIIALDDIIYGAIKDLISSQLFTLNITNYQQLEDGFQSVDIILKLNRNIEAADWLENNIQNWESITKAFNGTFNYRRIVEINNAVSTNNVLPFN